MLPNILNLVFSFLSIAQALPPMPGCETWLVSAEALSTFSKITRQRPSFNRAFVGRLWDAWNNGKSVSTWGISDRHNGHRIFSSRFEYVHALKSGDYLVLCDENWNSVREGILRLDTGFFQHAGDTMGPETKTVIPRLVGGGTTNDFSLAREWLRSPNAIALTTMSSDEQRHWDLVQRPDYERWLKYRENPVGIKSQSETVHRLAFYESHIEGQPIIQRRGDQIRLFVDDGQQPQSIRRGDYIFMFDTKNNLLRRIKFFGLEVGEDWFKAIDFLDFQDQLDHTTRMVLVRDHFFVN